MGVIPYWVLLLGLLLYLFALPILTLIHAGLAIAHKNTPATRLLLLGLLPSLVALIMLATPGYSGASFPFLRRYWPPLLEWSWLFGFVGGSWQFWPAPLASLVFGAEVVRRGNLPTPLIRFTIAAAYLGAIGAGYAMLWSLGQS
jgi:hypothetical protein